VRPRRGLRSLALVASAVLAPRLASAQLAVDHAELHLVPRGTLEQRVGLITVTNEGSTSVQASVRIEDWDRAEDGTNRWYPSGTVAGSCGKALQVFPLSVSLQPGASQSLRVTLDSNAVNGRECWGAAVVETVQPPSMTGRAITYVVRTAVKVYAEPAGLTLDGAVSDVRIVQPDAARLVSRDSVGPRVQVVFENTGKKHVVATGSVEFRRPDNSVAAKVALPDMYALPGAKSRVSALMPKLAPGQYVVLAIVDFGGSEIAAAQIEYEAK
jgi:P pilus assembly chaperone PapD